MLRILCYGDSVTFGEKDNLGGGWVDRLKSYYIDKYFNAPTPQVSVYNLGIGGETTDGLSQRFEVEFNARYIKKLETKVILAYGSNDIVIHKNKNRVPESYFLRNLKQCIQLAYEKNAEVILMSLLPISAETDNAINQYGQLRRSSDIQKYNTALVDLAKDVKCHFVDVYSALENESNVLSVDGLHPNSHGHQLIYEIMLSDLTSQISHPK